MRVVALEYDREAKIPWDSPERDYIITRTLREFMRTVAQAIRDGEIVREPDSTVFVGACAIPQW
jgi:hypothetical protein